MFKRQDVYQLHAHFSYTTSLTTKLGNEVSHNDREIVNNRDKES
jgi:hypothetical protein